MRTEPRVPVVGSEVGRRAGESAGGPEAGVQRLLVHLTPDHSVNTAHRGSALHARAGMVEPKQEKVGKATAKLRV